jgi:iron complex outermembrane receptor protein
MKKLFFSTTACALVFAAGAVHAQTASPLPVAAQASTAITAAAQDSSEIIVTGTRQTGLKAVDSAAPIQVLDSAALKRVGQPDLIQALAQNVPSFTAQAFGGDTSALTLSAKLRGVSPNDALVLVNGKRRHGTANLAVLGGPYQGGASADLNFIPVDAIDHVEVLTDGAAAQYGTDAIAGVVNIILKKAPQGGNLSVSSGSYMDGGGDTADITGNMGFAPLGDKSWLNLTFDSRFHGHSNRGYADPRLYNHPVYAANCGAAYQYSVAGTLYCNNVGAGGQYANSNSFPGSPNANLISGDAMYHLNVVSYDAGYELNNGATLYSFGTFGHKNAQAFENYRVQTTAPTIYPTGFNPKEELLENDYSYTAGIKGSVFGWMTDVSTTYGADTDTFHTEGTINPNFYNATGLFQSYIYDGQLKDTQWTTNLDVSKDFAVGLASPLTVAFGAEQRRDTYNLEQGWLSSYFSGGAQSYPGFSNLAAGKHARDNWGIYGDAAVSPIEGLKLDAAIRYEHFSDFGDTTVGKITGRYDFNPMIAVRGTISTGFRAPTLAEEYYASVNVGPTTASVQFPPNSAGAKSLGVDGLKPEKSDNYSIGLVLHPLPKVTATLDAYYIKIKDRIIGSGTVYAYYHNASVQTFPAAAAALAASGYTFPPSVVDGGLSLFTNGADTRTEGAEWVVTYAETYGQWGKVDWSFTGAYTDNKVTHVIPSLGVIPSSVLFDATALSYIQDAAPKYKMIFGALWTKGPWSANLRETLYGKSSTTTRDFNGAYQKVPVDAEAITDLELDYAIRKDLKLTLGANNVFNTYPTKIPASVVNTYVLGNSNGGVGQYPTSSPFGINGGYYYGKVTFTF